MAGAGNRFPALLPRGTQAMASNIIPEDQRVAAAAGKAKATEKAKAKAPAKPKVQAKEKAKEKAWWSPRRKAGSMARHGRPSF